jgi:hypothetical protein
MSKLFHKVLLAVFILTLALSLALPLFVVSTTAPVEVADLGSTTSFFEVDGFFPRDPGGEVMPCSYTWAG